MRVLATYIITKHKMNFTRFTGDVGSACDSGIELPH